MPLFGPPNVEKLKAKGNVRGLIKALRYEEDSIVRWNAARALGQIGDTRAVEPLIATLRSLSVSGILLPLSSSHAEVYPIFRGEESWLVRGRAAWALGEIGDARAVRPLIAALNDESEWVVRQAAAEALGQIGDPRAAKPLIRALQDREGSVRETAAEALDQLDWQPTADTAGACYWAIKREWDRCVEIGTPAVGVLLQSLKDWLSMREAADKTLKEAGSALDLANEPAHRKAVGVWLDAPDNLVQILKALGQIGDARVVEPLTHILRDNDIRLREAAAEALEQIRNARIVEPPSHGPEIAYQVTVGAPLEAPPRFQRYITRLQALPNTIEGIEQKITIYEDILRALPRHEAPVFWGAVQNLLGITYAGRVQGNRADNLERAIAAFNAALEVRTQDKFPVDWAMTQNNLGNAWRERIRGDRADNLERAIAACNAALEVYTRADFPIEWAMAQDSLGTVLLERIRGDRAENLERAIAAHTVALEVYTRADFPVDWAITQHNLGNALRERIRGDRADNLERAIAAYNAALEVRTRDKFPVDWADTQNSLGNALRERSRGNRAENLERAISAYTAALEVYTRVNFPTRWAMVQNNLGNAYAKRIRGDRADNLERAIAAYTAALEVRTRDDFPVQWATTQNNLGTALRERIRGDRADNLERAIAAYTAALEVRTQARFPVDWAMTQNSLGITYQNRIRGDRAENLERALVAYTAALEVKTRADFPTDWAITQVNLSTAYRNRIRGDRADNLEQAIAACTAALEVLTRDDFPVQWADTQNNLGNAYAERIRGDRADNLERAIAAYTAALLVRTRADSPVDWAMTQNNLGTALRERIRGDRAENLERAITAYTAALEVLTRTDFPVRWAVTQNNLGNALRERIQGDRAENLERAIAAYQATIGDARTMGITDDEHLAARNLGNLYYDRQEWSPAYNAFDTAIAALEAMRTTYFSEEAKTRLAEENALLYAHMIDTCLHLGRPQEALERAEESKGRVFLDQLGTDVFPVPVLPSEQQPLLEREANLVSELRALEHAIRNAPDETERRQSVTQQGQKRAALDEVWAQLEPYAPDYVALRQGDPVKYDDLQALVDGFSPAAALVEFYILPDKIIVFVLRSGEQEPAVAQVSMSQNKVLRHMDNYWREVVEYPEHADIGQRWQELAEPLLGDVLPHLDGAELVYLVPHGLLHYLPLHALRVDGDTLIDRFPIAYAPSAAVLGRVIQRTAGTQRTGNGHKALVLGYTPHEHERAVFEGEAVQVAEFFGTKAHLGKDATGALLREKGAQYDTLHLSCHGFFDPTDPLASGLQLADGVLTARDIMGLKLNAGLVTLSACQTALSEHQPGDELVGLTRALLYAGASSVLVTLWSVDAVAALELMGDFYGRLRGRGRTVGTSEAVALREAMLAMRKTKEHPYYWAPFVLVGDWR